MVQALHAALGRLGVRYDALLAKDTGRGEKALEFKKRKLQELSQCALPVC
jgi:hypothetical protein